MVKNNELEKLLQQMNPKEDVKKVVKVKQKRILYDFNKEDMRKGIVLSEILGPPKGRK